MGIADMAKNKSHFFLKRKSKETTTNVPNIPNTKLTLLSGKIKNVIRTITPVRSPNMTV